MISKRTWEQNLPEGTMYSPMGILYHYGPFTVDEFFIMTNPRFSWLRHIECSFHECLQPMLSRFERVV